MENTQSMHPLIQACDEAECAVIAIREELIALEYEIDLQKNDAEDRATQDSSTVGGVAPLKRKYLAESAAHQALILKKKGLDIDLMHAERKHRTAKLLAWEYVNSLNKG